MHCSNCDIQYNNQNDKFCSRCGKRLNMTNDVKINIGDSSVNVGFNSSIDNSTINVYSHTMIDPKEVAYIDRKSIKPLSIFGVHLKTTWLICSGGISLLGSLISIFTFWEAQISWFMLLMPIGGFILALGVALNKERFIHFFSRLNLELGSDKYIYRTVIEGKCPKCSGKLKLCNIGPKDHKVTVVRCTRNRDHIWKFDPTRLEDL